MTTVTYVQSDPNLQPGAEVQYPVFSLKPVSGTFSSGTTAADANQNLTTKAMADADFYNARLKAQFLAQVEAYNYMMASGVYKVMPIPPPVAPPSYVVVPGAPGSAGPSIAPNGPPIQIDVAIATVNNALLPSRQQTLSDPSMENKIEIGAQDYGVYYNTGPNDTWPANKMTPTQPDGHVYLKIPAPVGGFTITYPDGTQGEHGGWYERIS